MVLACLVPSSQKQLARSEGVPSLIRAGQRAMGVDKNGCAKDHDSTIGDGEQGCSADPGSATDLGTCGAMALGANKCRSDEEKAHSLKSVGRGAKKFGATSADVGGTQSLGACKRRANIVNGYFVDVPKDSPCRKPVELTSDPQPPTLISIVDADDEDSDDDGNDEDDEDYEEEEEDEEEKIDYENSSEPLSSSDEDEGEVEADVETHDLKTTAEQRTSKKWVAHRMKSDDSVNVATIADGESHSKIGEDKIGSQNAPNLCVSILTPSSIMRIANDLLPAGVVLSIPSVRTTVCSDFQYQNSVAVYYDTLKVGMCMSLCLIMKSLLLDYDIAPSQLFPGTWMQVYGFLAECRMKHLLATYNVFKRLFSVKRLLVPCESGVVRVECETKVVVFG